MGNKKDLFPLLIFGIVLVAALVALLAINRAFDNAGLPPVGAQLRGEAIAVGSAGISGYAVPWDPLISSTRAYMTVEPHTANTVLITVAQDPGVEQQYVYLTGYYSNTSGGTKTWKQFTFSNAPVAGTPWIRGRANVTLTVNSADSQEYVIAFVCRQYTGRSDFICGPMGPTPDPARRLWTIQDFSTSITPCAAGLTSCGGSCVNLTSNASNCGQCGTSCPSGVCTNGACTTCTPTKSCADYAGQCGTGFSNGCTNTLSCGCQSGTCPNTTSNPRVMCPCTGSACSSFALTLELTPSTPIDQTTMVVINATANRHGTQRIFINGAPEACGPRSTPLSCVVNKTLAPGTYSYYATASNGTDANIRTPAGTETRSLTVACTPTPKATACAGGFNCGNVSDGCGGLVYCGDSATGACPDNQFCSVASGATKGTCQACSGGSCAQFAVSVSHSPATQLLPTTGITITATATRLGEKRIFVDGRQVTCASSSPSIECVNVSTYTAGTHTYYAEAVNDTTKRDPAEGTKSFTVGPGCEACPTANQKRCAGNAVQTCTNGCWTQTEACTTSCSGGACATPCQSNCPSANAKQCNGTNYQTCQPVPNNANCLQWSLPPTACANGGLCTGAGECSASCTATAGQFCAASGPANSVAGTGACTAGQGNCFKCAPNFNLQNGQCVPTCTSNCQTANAKQCSGTGIQTCQAVNGNPACLMWTATTPCPGQNEICTGPAGQAQCAASCTTTQGQFCAATGPTNSVQGTGACAAGQGNCFKCAPNFNYQNGQCVPTCPAADQCTASSPKYRCSAAGNSVQKCVNNCYAATTTCESGDSCSLSVCTGANAMYCRAFGSETTYSWVTASDPRATACYSAANTNGNCGLTVRCGGTTQYCASEPNPTQAGDSGGVTWRQCANNLCNNGRCGPACTPSWSTCGAGSTADCASCTAWTACTASGTQTRTCTDSNNCGVTTGKPAETKSCTYTPLTVTAAAQMGTLSSMTPITFTATTSKAAIVTMYWKWSTWSSWTPLTCSPSGSTSCSVTDSFSYGTIDYYAHATAGSEVVGSAQSSICIPKTQPVACAGQCGLQNDGCGSAINCGQCRVPCSQTTGGFCAYSQPNRASELTFAACDSGACYACPQSGDINSKFPIYDAGSNSCVQCNSDYDCNQISGCMGGECSCSNRMCVQAPSLSAPWASGWPGCGGDYGPYTVTIVWLPAQGASSYRVYAAHNMIYSGGCENSDGDSTCDISYSAGWMTEGDSFNWYVEAVASDGRTARSDPITITYPSCW